jgi:hypothetical protein
MAAHRLGVGLGIHALVVSVFGRAIPGVKSGSNAKLER